jgi:hypothetical protein
VAIQAAAPAAAGHAEAFAMSIFALASGTLFRRPERKVSKAGKPYVSAKLRSGDGDSTIWIALFAFSDTAQAELSALDDGDALAAQGRLSAELYQPTGGGARVNLSMTVSVILPVKRRKRKPEMAATAPPLVPSRADYDDDLPF